MLEIRRSSERGVAEHGWLSSKHSFSFGHYYDPRHVGVGPLRVINEDRVQPGRGFGTHGHRDMEILSYVLDGALEHKDNMGNGSVIRYGNVQRMSAGTGVLHSEFNPSRSEPVHFLQIWITPDVQGIEPSYEEAYFAPSSKQGRWCLIASPRGREGSVLIHQNVEVYASTLKAGDSLSYRISTGRCVYLHTVRGSVVVNGKALSAGDAITLRHEAQLQAECAEDVEMLLFDLPDNE